MFRNRILSKYKEEKFGLRREGFGISPRLDVFAGYARRRVAASAYLLTSWLFETAKRPDDKANGVSFPCASTM